MPLSIVLETLHHKRFDEALFPYGDLNRLLPFGDPLYPLLGSVDPYGNTIFNGLQMERFIQEWDRVMVKAEDKDDKKLLAKVRELAIRCEAEPHTFLRFVGD
jgi:hypothetical protein